MGLSSPTIDEVPAARMPLKIVVSEAGQMAALKALVAQCIPVLQNPHTVSNERRMELAFHLRRALGQGECSEDEFAEDASDEPEYEPGSWLEDEP